MPPKQRRPLRAEPFTGFPREGIEFFRELSAHNAREWFLAHKDVYERACRAPMQALAAALEPRWGEARISRINRDLRFARGRPPYKTYIAAGVGGRYISLSPDGVWVGAGLYRPDPARLRRFRAAIDDPRTDGSSSRSSRRCETRVMGSTRTIGSHPRPAASARITRASSSSR
jgi:uncharacterized protein (DUF2461 family)